MTHASTLLRSALLNAGMPPSPEEAPRELGCFAVIMDLLADS